MKKQSGRNLYSLKETYWIFYQGVRTIKFMKQAKQQGNLTLPKIERIMLAVTEVNGCGICSYAHTKVALEAGMSNEEISNLLAGTFDHVPQEELTAVLFAQHYAESRGNPSRESWARMEEKYGELMIKGILGAIRGIMIGNVYGIAWSSFYNRFKGDADPRSSLGYELQIMTLGTLLIPVALIHGMASMLTRKPLISFEPENPVV